MTKPFRGEANCDATDTSRGIENLPSAIGYAVVPLLMLSVAAQAQVPDYMLKLNTGGPTAKTEFLQFSPDGQFLIAAGYDKAIRVWDVAELESSGSLSLHRTLRPISGIANVGHLLGLSFAPNSSVVVVGANYGGLLIDIDSGQVLAFLDVQSAWQSVAFSADGRYLASGHERGMITIWDMEPFWIAFKAGHLAQTNQRKSVINNLMRRRVTLQASSETPVFAASFSPEPHLPPQLITASIDKLPLFWKLAGDRWVRRAALAGHRLPAPRAAFTSNGNEMLTTGFDRRLLAWNRTTLRYRTVVDVNDDERVYPYPPSIGLLPHANRAVMAGWPTPLDCTVVATDSGRSITSFHLHDSSVTAVATHPKSDLVATIGGNAHEIYLWRPSNAKLVAKIGGLGRVLFDVAFSADGSRLAYCDEAIDPTTLSPSEKTRFDACWDNDSFGYLWGMFRGNQVLRPLRHVFDIKKLEPGPPLAESDSPTFASGRARLRLRNWEADRYVSQQGDSNSHVLVLFRNRREVSRITRQDPTDRINACALVETGPTKAVGVVVASRTKLTLHDVETGRVLRRFEGHSDSVMGLASSPDDTLLASVSSDQTIRLWNLQPGPTGYEKNDIARPLVSIFPATNGEWVAWTDTGHYASSPAGGALFGWHVNRGVYEFADFFTAERFQAALHRPDFVRDTLRTRGQSKITQLTADELLSSATPPVVSIVHPAHGQSVPHIKLKVHGHIRYAPSTRIDAVRLTVNGRDERALAVMPQGSRETFERLVTLDQGTNVVGVQAVARGGILSDTRTVRVVCTAKAEAVSRPNLFALVIGVSQHDNPSLNLKFAAKDARDIKDVLERQRGAWFDEVKINILSDAAATRENILQQLEWLQNAAKQRHDFIVIYLSGHGARDDRDNYYFVARNTNPARLKDTGVRWSLLQDSMNDADGKPFIILDTCHAAAVAGTGESAKIAYDGVLRDAATNSTGAITLASCLPHEVSLENAEWQNGAFSKALVEAFDGAGDFNSNQLLTVTELETYIAQRVETLTKGRQNPALYKSITVPSNLTVASLKATTP